MIALVAGCSSGTEADTTGPLPNTTLAVASTQPPAPTSTTSPLSTTVHAEDRPPITATVDDPARAGSYQHALLIERCMNEAGFSITIEGDNSARGITIQGPVVPPDQEALAWDTMEECREEPIAAGLVLPFPTEFDHDEHVEVYNFWIEVTIPCLLEHGYPINQPQSLDAFIQFQSGGPGSYWHPFDAVAGYDEFRPDRPDSPGERVWKDCPIHPDDV